jgi:hypothetical protein
MRTTNALRKQILQWFVIFYDFVNPLNLCFNLKKVGVVVLRLFDAFVMRKKEGKCFSPLAQKILFWVHTSLSITHDYNDKSSRKFFTLHILYANVQIYLHFTNIHGSSFMTSSATSLQICNTMSSNVLFTSSITANASFNSLLSSLVVIVFLYHLFIVTNEYDYTFGNTISDPKVKINKTSDIE